MTSEERARKMVAALKAAGPNGLSGDEICRALGIAPKSAEAHRLGQESICLPLSVIERDNIEIYIWAGSA